MNREIVTGIDVGTHYTKVIVSEVNPQNKYPRIISAGFAKTTGLKNGYPINVPDVVKTIKAAIKQAEQGSGVKIQDAYVAFGGVGLDTITTRGKALIGRVDSEVTESDTEQLSKHAKRSVHNELVNKKELHQIPLAYFLDNEKILGNPYGMQGTKLEGDIMFVTAHEPHLNDLITAIESADVAVLDVVASPIASSLVTLNKMQKMAGSALVNIGAETTSLIVFENNIPISIKIFPFGSLEATKALALEFKVSLTEAEQLKLGALSDSDYPQKKIMTTISKPVKQILKEIDAHLKSIDKSGLLPAGVIFSGGGSALFNLQDHAKSILKLPVDIASLKVAPRQLKAPSWDVAYGLCLLGAENQKAGFLGNNLKHLSPKNLNILSWLKKFLP